MFETALTQIVVIQVLLIGILLL